MAGRGPAPARPRGGRPHRPPAGGLRPGRALEFFESGRPSVTRWGSPPPRAEPVELRRREQVVKDGSIACMLSVPTRSTWWKTGGAPRRQDLLGVMRTREPGQRRLGPPSDLPRRTPAPGPRPHAHLARPAWTRRTAWSSPTRPGPRPRYRSSLRWPTGWRRSSRRSPARRISAPPGRMDSERQAARCHGSPGSAVARRTTRSPTGLQAAVRHESARGNALVAALVLALLAGVGWVWTQSASPADPPPATAEVRPADVSTDDPDVTLHGRTRSPSDSGAASRGNARGTPGVTPSPGFPGTGRVPRGP